MQHGAPASCNSRSPEVRPSPADRANCELCNAVVARLLRARDRASVNLPPWTAADVLVDNAQRSVRKGLHVCELAKLKEDADVRSEIEAVKSRAAHAERALVLGERKV